MKLGKRIHACNMDSTIIRGAHRDGIQSISLNWWCIWFLKGRRCPVHQQTYPQQRLYKYTCHQRMVQLVRVDWLGSHFIFISERPVRRVVSTLSTWREPPNAKKCRWWTTLSLWLRETRFTWSSLLYNARSDENPYHCWIWRQQESVTPGRSSALRIARQIIMARHKCPADLYGPILTCTIFLSVLPLSLVD